VLKCLKQELTLRQPPEMNMLALKIIEEAKKRKPQIAIALQQWSQNALRDFPWRKNITPYKILVAEFLLKRTTATAVNRVFEDFIRLYPSLEALSTADSNELSQFLKTLGYHKERSKTIKEAAQFIMDKYNGKIPKDRESLIGIPNIGPYTAGAILSLGFGIKAPMKDSNVNRILQRVFFKNLPKRSVNRILMEVAQEIVPKTNYQIFNLALIDLGASVCTYRKANCKICPLKDVCDYPATQSS
jgi:A/G-specific adenine glycosylase